MFPRNRPGMSLPALLALVIVSLTGFLPPSASAAKRVRVGHGIYLIKAQTKSGLRPHRDRLAPGLQPRIVGGNPVSIGSVPWQAAVDWAQGVAPGNGYDRLLCGG